MSNVEYHGERYNIQLRRLNTGAPWGFRLQGGLDFNSALAVQVVQPNSIAEQCGLMSGDGILSINGVSTDQLTHEQAKQEIVRGGCGIDFLVQRGTMKVWKPQVTPMTDMRPQQLNTIRAATGEEFQPVQKTSLAMNSPQEPCRIGSSHNRAAQPFGAQKQAVPNVVHSQYNTPIGLYSADNIASTYATQTAGIQKEMAGLDLNQSDVGQRMTGTYQQLPTGQGTQDEVGLSGFRSVSAPAPKPPGQQKPQPQSMRCAACDMLATGVIVKANGVPFHVGCFKCESCGMNLKQKGYFVVEGKLYCETHARRKVQPPGPDMVAVPIYR